MTDVYIDATRAWLERVVIGLNLCPFAKAVHAKGQIHYAVCHALSASELLDALDAEIKALLAFDPKDRDTTLLIAPGVLEEFLDFNDFLHQANRLLKRQRLQGVIQLASFHPCYQFAGVPKEDISNFTNRSPYPMLHLLREDSIDKAVASFPQAGTIYEKNIQTLRALGPGGWAALNSKSSEAKPI